MMLKIRAYVPFKERRGYVSELPCNCKPCSKGILYCSLSCWAAKPRREFHIYVTPSDNNTWFFHSVKSHLLRKITFLLPQRQVYLPFSFHPKPAAERWWWWWGGEQGGVDSHTCSYKGTQACREMQSTFYVGRSQHLQSRWPSLGQ